MHRTRACEVLCLHLGLRLNRVAAIGVRLADAGLIPKASGKAVPDLTSRELVRLFLAAVCDRGLGAVPQTVAEFENIKSDTGLGLGDTLEAAFRGDIQIGGVALQLDPASALVETDKLLLFGPSLRLGAMTVRHIPGAVMAAIITEFKDRA